MRTVGRLLACLIAARASANQPVNFPAPASWQADAPLAVSGAGTVIVEVPPDLHRESAGGLDLDLLGPDGSPRPFELFLREDRGETGVRLQPSSVRLAGRGFVWEARVAARDRIRATSIDIAVAAGDYVGSVRIDATVGGRVVELARDAAVYAARGTERSRIEIAPGVYESFRLTFTAFGKLPVPVDAVTAFGTRTGEDHPPRRLSLPATLTRMTSGGWIDARLPGSGLSVASVEVAPTTRFSGQWSVERETVRAGRREYVQVAAGNEAAIGRSLTVRMPVDGTWPGRALRIRLVSGDRHLGAVSRIMVRVNTPRMAFVAEAPGTYRIVAGCGRDAAVAPVRPAGPQAAPRAAATVGAVRRNARWKPEDLVAQFGLSGARFAASGYLWKSPVRVAAPGYWRIALPEQASLEGDPAGLRLVRSGLQVPFFLDDGEIRGVNLPVTVEHEPASNTTTWRLALPRASTRWIGLRLRSHGVFARTVEIAPDVPVPTDIPAIARLAWTHAAVGPAEIFVPLGGLRRDATRLRVTVAHGQNRPITLDAAEAMYRAPGLSFLADAADGYELHGGHPSAGAVRYDLDLVASRLAGELPGRAEAGDPVESGGGGVLPWLVRPFGEARWGLYAVLGVLTAVLVAIIVRLFPAPSDRRGRK